MEIRIVVTDDGFGFPDEIENTTGFFRKFYAGVEKDGLELVAEVPENHAPSLTVGLCG